MSSYSLEDYRAGKLTQFQEEVAEEVGDALESLASAFEIDPVQFRMVVALEIDRVIATMLGEEVKG